MLAIIYAWTPKSSPGARRPKDTLGPRPNTEVRLVRGLTGRRTISASLEASPPRPLTAHHISASPGGKRLTLGEQENSASFEDPSAEPSAGPRYEGKLRLVQDPPQQTRTVTHPLNGTSAFITNRSAAWCGCQMASAATPHSGRDRSPVRLL